MSFLFVFNSGLEQTLHQEWPVNAEVDLDDMEQNEGIYC